MVVGMGVAVGGKVVYVEWLWEGVVVVVGWL